MSNRAGKGSEPQQASKSNHLKSMLAELARKELKLKLPLLDAALTGAALALKPANKELRVRAARTWASIRPALEHHLSAEEETLLRWADSRSAVRHEIVERLRQQHSHLRELLKTMRGVSFEDGTDATVATAAHDLCALAVSIDDMVAGEERDLLPMVRRALFARGTSTNG